MLIRMVDIILNLRSNISLRIENGNVRVVSLHKTCAGIYLKISVNGWKWFIFFIIP